MKVLFCSKGKEWDTFYRFAESVSKYWRSRAKEKTQWYKPWSDKMFHAFMHETRKREILSIQKDW